MKKTNKSKMITMNNSILFQAFAFDGENYFFCAENKNRIYVYDSEFKILRCFHTSEEYGAICYDSKEDCLWAIPKRFDNAIIKYNKNFKRIGHLCLPNDHTMDLSYITSMSFCSCDHTLVISTKDKIFKLSISDNKISELTTIQSICKVLCLPNGYLVITKEKDNLLIFKYNCNFDILYKTCLEECSLFCDAILTSDGMEVSKQDGILHLTLLMKKNCSSNMIFPVTIKRLPKKCKEKPEEECSNPSDTKCPKPCTKKCFCEYLESIALIQTALSHILNAEGEKIQKTIATTNDINKLLCVNKEVNKTIVNVTHLEQIIYDSLQTCLEKEDCGCSCNCNCSCNCSCNCNCKCNCADEKNKCTCDVDGGNLDA